VTDAWSRLRSLIEEFAVDDENLEHLLDQATLWISWSVLHADPTSARRSPSC
jgi:CHASE3 domain sensor protein